MLRRGDLRSQTRSFSYLQSKTKLGKVPDKVSNKALDKASDKAPDEVTDEVPGSVLFSFY